MSARHLKLDVGDGAATVEDLGSRSGTLVPAIELNGAALVPVFTSLTQLTRFRPEGGGYIRTRVIDS